MLGVKYPAFNYQGFGLVKLTYLNMLHGSPWA